MRLALLLILPFLADAQVEVVMSPLSSTATKRILGRRAAQVLTICPVAFTNTGTERVVIANPEALIISRAAQMQPYASVALPPLLAEANQRNPWAVAGRVLMDGAALGVFLSVSDVWKLPAWSIKALAGLNSNAPYIANRLAGVPVNTLANFAALKPAASLQLDPGQTGQTVLFIAPQAKPTPYSFVVSTAAIEKVKVLQ